MMAALRYETVRVLTVRSTWISLAVTLLGVTGLSYLATTPFEDLNGENSVQWWNTFVQPLLLAAILSSVVAAQNIGQEYRFGLIRLTLTSFPQRGTILTAKAISVIVVGMVFALVSYLGSWIAVALLGFPLPPESAPAPDATFLLRGVVFVVLWSLSAWAIAGITRQTALGIALPIVLGLIVEQILSAVVAESAPWLVGVLPWSAASRWPATPADIVGDSTAFFPVGWAALGVFAVWIAVFVAIEAWSFIRRDA